MSFWRYLDVIDQNAVNESNIVLQIRAAIASAMETVEEEVDDTRWFNASDDADDEDKALHHFSDERHAFAPHRVNKNSDSDIVIIKTKVITSAKITLIYFEYLALAIFFLLSYVCVATSVMVFRLVILLSTVLAVMRFLVQVVVFVMLIFWCMLLVGHFRPSRKYRWQRGLMAA